MAKKPFRIPEFRDVLYNNERWTLLEKHRNKAMLIMGPLQHSHVDSIVHGSVARGDVSAKSDIDVFLPAPVSSFVVETVLERAHIPVARRLVVQATPTYAMKAHIEIDEKTSISFPLMKLRKVEREFYKFGGIINLDNLKKSMRVSGVDKRLMLIEPTEKGHRESAIVGREEHAARILGISVQTVLDRVHTLMRRDEVGRTGVFVKEELRDGETFEMVLEKLAEKNPAVRRRLASIR